MGIGGHGRSRSGEVSCSPMNRHSWILFVVIGAVGVAMSIGTMVDPNVLLGKLSELDPASPPGTPATAFFARWTATALFGVNAMTVIIACTSYRSGERWAGVALLYWPLMFLSHLLMYRWGPMSFVQLGWLALSVPALVGHFRRSARVSADLTPGAPATRLA